MAKTKLCGIEFEGLPTVTENAVKMEKARADLKVEMGQKRLKAIASMKGMKLLGKSKDVNNEMSLETHEMKNVTPKENVIEGVFKKIEEKKKEDKDGGN
jgi:hypothetical protein